MSFFIFGCSISSLNICEGVLLQRDEPGPVEERGDAVEEVDDAEEGGPEVAGSCAEEKEGEREGGGNGEISNVNQYFKLTFHFCVLGKERKRQLLEKDEMVAALRERMKSR